MNQLSKLFEYGFALHQQGKLADAQVIYEQILQVDPINFDAIQLLGVVSAQTKNYEKAVELITRALKINPRDDACHNNLGNALKNLKRFDEAINSYDKALNLKPDYAEAYSNKGVVMYELKHFDEAINCYDKALIIEHYYPEAHSNKGNALYELKRYDEAIAHYDQALSLKPDYHEAWVNKGVTLSQLKRYDEAIAHYDQALSLKPDYAEGWSNKANALNELKRYEEAIAHYDQALRLKPDYAQVYSNKGNTLQELNCFEEAITHYDQALSLKPDYAEGWSNKANALNELKRYEEAIAHYDQALSLKPDVDWVHGYLLHTKMIICSWSGLPDSLKEISKKVMKNERVSQPFSLLASNDDPLLHRKCAEVYAQEKYSLSSICNSISKHSKKEKIRIGYFSPDFKEHAVSYLTAGLFEFHDKDKFEIFAFSLQKAPIADEMNSRLRGIFDRFIDVENMPDLEIARLSRKFEIDIAIDLAGPTKSSRLGIFSYRVAPIQVNWLGYPGTIGNDFIDYIVADKTIIPESYREFYAEKVVYLPNTYMVDDSKRIASSKIFTRKECGLPEKAFVFCCLNNSYKFNPHVLDCWAKILLRINNSVFWISENNKYFKVNIINEFERRGINPSRVVFAQKIELMSDYLARCALADLFLDTYPYNAHTTAVDSLKAGVPVLTLMGKSFASRVAASLLNAVGLPELITNTQEEYETLAIELAMNPKKLADIKEKLAVNRLTTPLFDTPLFTKNLEAAYIQIYERYQSDLKPDHIFIDYELS